MRPRRGPPPLRRGGSPRRWGDSPRALAVQRVVALVVGLLALAATRSFTRGWPWWLTGLMCLLAFAVAARAVNAIADARRVGNSVGRQR